MLVDNSMHMSEVRYGPEMAQSASTRPQKPFPTPASLAAEIPRSFPARALVEGTRCKIRDILHGRDRERMLVVVGPCSIHAIDEAIAYAKRLRRVMRSTGDELVIVMRTYFEKPRSRGGWKGFLNDPGLDGGCDMARGLREARQLLLELNEHGVPCACEFVDPMATPYLEDLVSWGAIGARTTESQPHRELASRLAMPVGFKNGLDGRSEGAEQAIEVARQSHSILTAGCEGLPSVTRSRGNSDAHVVLRGGVAGPNCDAENVDRVVARGVELGLARPLLIDCSHGNSGRDPRRQSLIAREISGLLTTGRRGIAGLMLESNLKSGSQRFPAPGRSPVPGVSLTDPCISIDETEALLLELAATLQLQRNRHEQGGEEDRG